MIAQLSSSTVVVVVVVAAVAAEQQQSSSNNLVIIDKNIIEAQISKIDDAGYLICVYQNNEKNNDIMFM